MAKIIFYTRDPKQFGTEITCTLALSAANSHQFHSVYSQSKLENMLQHEIGSLPIGILAAMTHQELDDLYLLKQMYQDMPVVLIVADESKKTLQKAHKIRPKFITTIHHDFACVLSVVDHISRTKNVEPYGTETYLT